MTTKIDSVLAAGEWDQAYISPRLLPDYLANGQEWVAPGVLHEERVWATYYFDADDLLDDGEQIVEAEDLPWDADHVVHICTEDETLVTRDYAGFGTDRPLRRTED